MAVDWQRTRNTVERLIGLYGRAVSFVNDVGPADPTEPLGLPGDRLVVSNVMAVFVRPSGYIKLGESDQMDPGMWPEADKIMLVLPSLTDRYQDFTRVIDTDGQEYKIYKTELLQPGPVPVLIYVGLKQ
jgi:hypothetical protein